GGGGPRADHPFTSPQLEREGGAAIGEAVAAGVDLDDPDVTFEADVRPNTAYVFAERLEGPGGLPVGTQAPLVALISGGIDSPVAAFELLRRGAPVVPVYVDLGDYGGVDHRARAIAACERLGERAPNHDLRPYVVDGGETIRHLVESVERGRMLSVRRYFFAVAETIADIEDAAGIVTGEALGQKSSQTARNLQVTTAAVDMPVHRPLLTVDKPEITNRARGLGTYEEAEIEAGCNRLVPPQPETEGRLEGLLKVEPDDLFERADADGRAATRVDL
ncbi:MAG: thiamine biosynthesis protein ThiI, partial [Natronomonas sp.]|uniref:tRNA sulfurtransferase n=1 Tax=Natronomonas sp. TaxID=2184060 RepID=UPI003989460B